MSFIDDPNLFLSRVLEVINLSNMSTNAVHRNLIAVIPLIGKALRYNFSFGNSLSKQLWNLTKVNTSSLTKLIPSLTS